MRFQSALVTPFIIALMLPAVVSAATSPRAAPSPFGGNGHNVTFDGRLFIVRTTPGWEATVLRPEATSLVNGFVDVSQAFSPRTLIQVDSSNENALALCEDVAQPVSCEQNGTPNQSGAFDCYHLTVIDSDALAQAPSNVMRMRKLRVIVAQPGTASATIDSFTWLQATHTPLSPALRGIEPSVTRDGKLLVWQGHPSNNGDGDTLVYSVNSTPCGMSGWSAPKSITAMNSDPLVFGKYKLAEKPLRGADGATFASGQVFYGAYPWVFPDGDAINFTATGMPCKTPPPNEQPPGCGPRRNALSFIGYPTNWQLAHVDGAVNPDTDETVRLFFSSPAPLNVSPYLPVTSGVDVWPFFGSNTSNYTEIVFDDGLDGRYAGLWHLNELVDNFGKFDLTRTPDSSGYSNTGKLTGGAAFPAKNNGVLGKAVAFNGTSARVEVPHAASLNPVNAITVELWVKPASDPDCDGKNNYRLLLGKGNIGDGAYTLVLEENRDLQARVRVAGGAQYSIAAFTTLPLNQWSHVAVQYDAGTGTMAFVVNGVETNRVVHPPATLAGTTHPVTIGGPLGTRAACPDGDGAFHGELDEVAVSRIWRYGTPPGAVDAGTPPSDAGSDAGTAEPDGGASSNADAGASSVDAGDTADAGVTGPGMSGSGEDGGAVAPATSSSDGGAEGGSAVVGATGLGCSAGASVPFGGLMGLWILVARRRRQSA